MKDVLQKNCEKDQETIFQMRLKRSAFLVKNFTEGIIYVSLGDNDTRTMIGAGSWEKVFNNIENNLVDYSRAERTSQVKVTASTAGIVEVASVDE